MPAALILLVACAPTPPALIKTQVVQIEVPKTLHVPADTFNHCLPTSSLPGTPPLLVGDALHWAEDLNLALQQCNQKLDLIQKALSE